MNKRIIAWLEEGRIKDPLTGANGCHLQDVDDLGAHDILLTTRTLIEWAHSRVRGRSAAPSLT